MTMISTGAHADIHYQGPDWDLPHARRAKLHCRLPFSEAARSVPARAAAGGSAGAGAETGSGSSGHASPSPKSLKP